MNLKDEFDKNWQKESKKHAAVTIRNEVKDWTGSFAPIAKKRWMWELLQNAIDTAKENEISNLHFDIVYADGNLTVKHNGGHFVLNEIIALVSGGTSKYFGRETLGKFGKGFLVTHVLSKIVTIEGWVSHEELNRQFEIELNRSSPDETVIENNINRCAEQLSEEHTNDNLTTNDTVITYKTANQDAVQHGLDILQAAIPFVMFFNPVLYQISVTLGDKSKIWRKERPESLTFPDSPFEEFQILTPTGLVIGLKAASDQLEIAVQLEKSADSSLSLIDTSGSPYIYYYLPLYDSDTINASYALNSTAFTVDTNRSFIEITNPDNSKILAELPQLLDKVVDYLIQSRVIKIHKIAHLDLSRTTEESKQFLKTSFAKVPEILTTKLIVNHKTDYAQPSNSFFPVGRYLNTYVPGLTSEIYDLLVQRFENVPTAFPEWESIIKDWEELGYNRLSKYSLETIIIALPDFLSKINPEKKGDFVTSVLKALILARDSTKSLPNEISASKLLLNQSSTLVAPQAANIDSGYLFSWDEIPGNDSVRLRYFLTQKIFLDWIKSAKIEKIDDGKIIKVSFENNSLSLILNDEKTKVNLEIADFRTNELILNTENVKQNIYDSEVDEELKDIAKELGWNIRDQLIERAIMKDKGVRDFIQTNLCPGREIYDSQVVAKKLWESYVSSKWKENANKTEFRKALLKFVIWLALKRGKDTKNLVDPDSLPILCFDNKFRSCSEMQNYPFIWPLSTWKDSLKGHVSEFSQTRIMSEDYLGLTPEEDREKLLAALGELHVAYNDILILWSEKELSLEEAKAVGVNSSFTTKVSVPNCSDVIGLQDMTSAAIGAKDIDRASKVLDFILSYLIDVDESWITPTTIDQGKQLYPSYWLAVLKTKDWIPSSNQKHFEPLNSENLERLLVRLPELRITQNVENFLYKHFQLNLSHILALKLRSISPHDKRIGVFDGLLSLSPEESESITPKMEAHLDNAQLVRRNKKLGKIVEKVVKAAFEEANLMVEWTGIGSDIGIIGSSDDIGSAQVFNPINSESKILIEVKATTSEMVRLTLPQSEEALKSKSRFILCVADMRDGSLQGKLDDTGEPSDTFSAKIIESLRFTTNIGEKIQIAVSEAIGLQGHQSDLKNSEVEPGVQLSFEESSIRVGVLAKIWSIGITFNETVAYCKDML